MGRGAHRRGVCEHYVSRQRPLAVASVSTVVRPRAQFWTQRRRRLGRRQPTRRVPIQPRCAKQQLAGPSHASCSRRWAALGNAHHYFLSWRRHSPRHDGQLTSSLAPSLTVGPDRHPPAKRQPEAAKGHAASPSAPSQSRVSLSANDGRFGEARHRYASLTGSLIPHCRPCLPSRCRVNLAPRRHVVSSALARS
jgi:hypothetical protein